MNSTEQHPDEQRLRQFFADRLVPLAQSIRADEVDLINSHPEDDAATWYIPYPADAEELTTFDASQLGARLHELWERQGFPQLMAISDDIGELAEALKQDLDVANEDVSPFIYVMF